MARMEFTVLVAALAMLATAAHADGVPSPANSTIPNHVTLVCMGPAGPDSIVGHVTVTHRDLANNPMVGSNVVFDFSACTDVTLAADQHDPRLAVHCAQRSVSAITDQNGVAAFTVLGTGKAGPASPANSLRIYADGVLLGGVSVAVLDRDGVGGLTLADLAVWTADYFSATNPPRADMDGNGAVSVADLSRWAAAYFGGNNVLSVGSYCP